MRVASRQAEVTAVTHTRTEWQEDEKTPTHTVNNTSKMGKSCCAIACKNRYNKNSGLSFFRLPKATEKRSKWIAAIRRNGWNPGRETWICGCHFLSGNFFLLFWVETALREGQNKLIQILSH